MICTFSGHGSHAGDAAGCYGRNAARYDANYAAADAAEPAANAGGARTAGGTYGHNSIQKQT